jgi:hypothetical protein
VRATRGLILAEVVVLVGGRIVQSLAAGESYEDVVVYRIGRPALAAALLGAILLAVDEAGAGDLAAAFGGLVVLGYLLAAGGAVGTAAQQTVERVFSIQTGEK